MIRIIVYGVLSGLVYLVFVPVFRYWLDASNELRKVVNVNFLEEQCNYDYNCRQGYSTDCGGTIASWLIKETEEMKLKKENDIKILNALRKACKSKLSRFNNSWSGFVDQHNIYSENQDHFVAY